MADALSYLAEHPFLAGLPEAVLERLAPHARLVVHHTGRPLFRQGDRADRFWLVRSGRASLELGVEGRGDVVIDQIGPGGVVGWSWLFPPYRCQFSAVAADLVHSIDFDAEAVRRLCEEDPAVGYELTKRFAAVLAERLRSTRLRLVDVYAY
jgi:CRP/FNR family transcriptional regulator, cyclic AMP receptor protein